MKRLFILILLVFIGIGAWRISERLSADAIGMALGVLFGVMAGIPVALLVLASARRRDGWQEEGHAPNRRGGQALPQGYSMPMQQPPVIVLAAPGYPQQMQGQGGQMPMHRMLPAPHEMAPGVSAERRFKVVGEQEEWIEEW